MTEEIIIKGTCKTMCPSAEIKERERERLLSIFEIKIGTERNRRPEADYQKVVKSYHRSAAGHRMPLPLELRPVPVLTKTTKYLISLAYNPPKDKDWINVYDFVTDRLRAVRQDLVIQRLEDINTIQLLETMVLFHIYSMFMLCEHKKFDFKLNKDMLIDSIKRCLMLYDNYDIKTEKRGTIESIYALISIDNSESLQRIITLENTFKTVEVKYTIKLLISFLTGNYIKQFRLMKDLSAPLICSLIHQLPIIRRRALRVLSNGYHSKILTLPVEKVAEWLYFNDYEQCINECTIYGFDCNNGKIQFQKSAFKNEEMISISKDNYLGEKISECDIEIEFCAKLN